MEKKTAKEIMDTLDPEIKTLLAKVLNIEKSYRHLGHLSERNAEEIGEKIISEIERMVR